MAISSHGLVIMSKSHHQKIHEHKFFSWYFFKVMQLWNMANALYANSLGRGLTILVARASWMTPDDRDATCSSSRFFSTSMMDCNKLSRLSCTLWDWAIAFCSRAERSSRLEERLWKWLSMESGKIWPWKEKVETIFVLCFKKKMY